MKKIMILGASILQLPAIKRAKAMGMQVIAVDMDSDAIGFKEDGIIKEVISTIDTPSIMEAARKHGIDAIMTLASDKPMRSVAAVAKELGLVGISEQTALNATNKAIMRQCLKAHGVPIPEFYKIETAQACLAAVETLRQKNIDCIIKPVDNSGSRGVDLLKEYDKDAILKAYDYSRSFSKNGEVIVEEYMEGPEVSVETLSVDGICHVIQITDKLTTGAPYFVEMGHHEPSLLPVETKKRIENVAIEAVRAIGIENGPSHTEIKVTKDGPKIVEIGARLGGDNITTHLVPLSTGVDMVECCIRIALGGKPDLTKRISMGSAIRYLRTDIGVVHRINGLEAAREIAGIQQVSIVHGVGEMAAEIRSSTDRIGFVIAQAETTEKAIAACEEAIEKIDVKVLK